MAFMEKEIFEDWCYVVETRDAGTCFVPESVVGRVDGNFPIDEDVEESDAWKRLREYCEGSCPESIDYAKGYVCRMSAPGYMDCTEWSMHATFEEANDYLESMYCEGGEAEEEEG